MAMRLIQPSDRFFVAGARGMAGSAIVRALQRNGYGDPAQHGELLTPSRQELNLLDDVAVRHWMSEKQPDVVVLAAATVGGIEANRSRPADFLLENLRIETQVIEAAWRAGVRRLLFLERQLHLPQIRRAADSRGIAAHGRPRAHQCLVCNCQDRRNQAMRGAAPSARL